MHTVVAWRCAHDVHTDETWLCITVGMNTEVYTSCSARAGNVQLQSTNRTVMCLVPRHPPCRHLFSCLPTTASREFPDTPEGLPDLTPQQLCSKANELFSAMQAAGVQVQEATYASMARVACISGDAERAHGFARAAKAQGEPVRLRTNQPALLAYALQGNDAKAQEVEAELVAAGVDLTGRGQQQGQGCQGQLQRQGPRSAPWAQLHGDEATYEDTTLHEGSCAVPNF